METYSNKETAATRQHMANMRGLQARAAKCAKINTICRKAITAALVVAAGAYIAGSII